VLLLITFSERVTQNIRQIFCTELLQFINGKKYFKPVNLKVPSY